VSSSGQVRYSLGERLADRYLEFVAGRCRPNTLRAVAFDLKSFFTVVGKDPVEVTAADVFDFLADRRGDSTGDPGHNRSPPPARQSGVCDAPGAADRNPAVRLTLGAARGGARVAAPRTARSARPW
jgi:hypothetical protein